jgi:Predicted transcriptional regulators
MMLSQSLRELCGDGLVNRAQFQEIPPRVEYSITDDGATILPAIQLLSEWAKAHERKNTV